MDSDVEFLVVKTPKGRKHIPVSSLNTTPISGQKNEFKRLFQSKVTAVFNLNNNENFNILRATKLFDTIKKIDKNAVIYHANNPKCRIYLTGDMPKDESEFRKTFEPELKNRNKQVQIVFQLESDYKVSDMKRDPKLLSFLNQEPKTFFREHEWSSTNVVSIGMFTGKHYSATFRQDYQRKLQAFINEIIAKENEGVERDDISTATEIVNNTPYSYVPDTDAMEMPRIEVNPMLRSHWNRDAEGKKIGEATKSMVLNIRCEASHANNIQRILYNYRDQMDKYEYGMFMSYEHARSDNDLFGRVLKQNNAFHNSVKIITIYGLHEEVAQMDLIDQNDNKKYNGFETLSSYNHNELQVTYSFERTTRTEDLGKWLVIANAEAGRLAYDLVTDVMNDWSLTDAYESHLDDNESYSKGVRFENNPSFHSEYLELFGEQAKFLNDNCSLTHSDGDSIDTNSTKSNKRKKGNTVKFEYSTHEFPEFSSNQAKPSNGAWAHPCNPNRTSNSSNNSGSTDSTNSSDANSTIKTNQSLAEFEEKFNGQMKEMQSYVKEKSEEAAKEQKSLQEKLLLQNELILEYRNLLTEQEKNHKLQMDGLNGKIDVLTEQVGMLVNFISSMTPQNNPASPNNPVNNSGMDITPKGKKQSIFNSLLSSMTGSIKPTSDSDDEIIHDEPDYVEPESFRGGTKKFNLPKLG